MNKYTLDALRFQRERLQIMIDNALYEDERKFYRQTLAEVNKDIENIEKNPENNTVFE